MDAASALADLAEISSQVEAAVIVDASGSVIASTLADDAGGERLARVGFDLLTAAEERFAATGRRLTQLEAALREGSVFVARENGLGIVARTSADPSSGLVFYDLNTCLHSVAEAATKPKPKRRTPKKEQPADA